MIWNSYSQLEGKHAILSASKNAWVNYDADKTVASYMAMRAAQYGTKEHEFAKMAIELGHKLPEDGSTISMYVNDAISYRMRPEQTLFVSEWAFGTADAIVFRNNILRVHDLKTGLNEVANFTQLEIYATFFCMEYSHNPFAFDKIEMRIYQNNDVKIEEADPDRIIHIREKLKHDQKILTELMKEEAA